MFHLSRLPRRNVSAAKLQALYGDSKRTPKKTGSSAKLWMRVSHLRAAARCAQRCLCASCQCVLQDHVVALSRAAGSLSAMLLFPSGLWHEYEASETLCACETKVFCLWLQRGWLDFWSVGSTLGHQPKPELPRNTSRRCGRLALFKGCSFFLRPLYVFWVFLLDEF